MASNPKISKDSTQEIFTDAFRQFVGRYKKYTADEFCSLTGIDRRTVDKWLCGASEPSATLQKNTMQILGVEYVNAYLLDLNLCVVEEKGEASKPAATALKFDDLANEIMHLIHDDGVFSLQDRAFLADKLIALASDAHATGRAWKKETGKIKLV